MVEPTVPSIAFALRAYSKRTPTSIGKNHGQEMIAAALGYTSFYAFAKSDCEASSLAKAQHFVPDTELFAVRCRQLNYNPDDVWPLMKAAFAERHATAILHTCEAGLDHAAQALTRQQILNAPHLQCELTKRGDLQITGVDFPFSAIRLAALPAVGEVMEEHVNGFVSAAGATETDTTVYRIAVTARRVIARTGKTCIAAPATEVLHLEFEEHPRRQQKTQTVDNASIAKQKKSPRSPQKSVAFCEELFSRVSGRARVRYNNLMPCFDPNEKSLFISDITAEKDPWMPASAFLKNLTDQEIEALANLPAWNGNNEITLSVTVLNALHRAILRHRKRKIQVDHHCTAVDSRNEHNLLPNWTCYHDSDAPFFTESVENGVAIRRSAYD